MIIELENIPPTQLEALALLWDAPSAQAAPLAQFLATPIQIRRRIGRLSAQGRDELTALLEATTESVPFEALRQAAIEELAEMILVEISDEEPMTVTLPESVAHTAIEVLPATPCRLGLLLRGLSGEGLLALFETLRAGQTPPPTPDLPAALKASLCEASQLAGIVGGLGQATARTLWEIVSGGGLIPLDQANEALDDEKASLVELTSKGLLWHTPYDVRIPVEVLRALLELRLQRQVHRAAARLGALRRLAAARDNVRPFPTSAGRWLSHAAMTLRHHDAEVPIDHDSLQGLLDADPGPILEARLKLSCAAGLLTKHQGTVSVAPSLSLPSGRLSESMGDRLVARVVEGERWSGISEASKGIYGPDAQWEDAPIEPEDEETEALCAIAPHLLTPEEATSLVTGARAGALRLLRALLQQLLSSLHAGQQLSLGEVEVVVEALAAVARGYQRLIGCTYARDPRPPSPQDRHEAVQTWLTSLALPMGWLRPEGPAVVVDETPPQDALPLLVSLGAAGRAHQTQTRQPGLEALRVMAQAPGASPSIVASAAPLMPLWHLDEPPPDTLTTHHSLGTSLSDQVQAFIESAAPPDAEVAALLRDFAQGQTSARQLQGLRSRDLERFLVCWIRVDVPAASLARVRAIFDGLTRIAAWAEAGGAAMSVTPTELRGRLEGHLMRTCSAEAAFRAHHPATPPGDLLALRPELAFDGLVEVVSLHPGERMLTAKRLRGGKGLTFKVRTTPEPLRLLQVGDLIDAQLVRYGEVCWFNRLRHVLVAEAGHFL